MIKSKDAREIAANEILKRIDEYCVGTFSDGHRTHLGASLIGNKCSRNLWYVFRWAKKIEHSGRLLRLFKRGHKEEENIVKLLRAIGFVVNEFDPESFNEETGTYNQYRISDCEGHFGGSLDGIGKLPKDIADALQYHEPVLFEFKTISDKYFSKLSLNGMIIEKPVHFDQTCVYGAKKELKYCVYVTVNKNNDALHIEIIELDHENGIDNIRKATDIINSQEPPQKLSQSKTHFECRFCDFYEICHNNAEIDRNCRSCTYASPVADAKWECSKVNRIIPKEKIGDEQPCWVGVQ